MKHNQHMNFENWNWFESCINFDSNQIRQNLFPGKWPGSSVKFNQDQIVEFSYYPIWSE